MKNFYLLFFLLLGCGKVEKFCLLEWKVGQWVSYTINGEPVEVAIVGEESTLFWVETQEPGIIVKALIDRNEIDKPKRLIVKKIGTSPMEFRIQGLCIKNKFPVFGGEKVGKEELLTLRCGKIKVIHIKEEEKEVWLSKEVPIFGVVKYEDSDTHIVLQNYGLRGAKSKIKGPVEVVNL